MVDRGPDSYAVVEHFRSGVLAGTHAAVAGNHEALMLRTIYHERRDLFEQAGVDLPYWVEKMSEFLYSRPAYQRWGSPDDWIRFNRLNWTSQGGGEALESYGCHAAKPDTWNIPSDHIAFLCGLPLLWQDATCVVTHALAQAIDIHQLKQGRRLDPVGQFHTLWSRSLPRERPDFNRVHVSGHTPMRRVQRKRHLGLVRVDLGAFGGGRLGAYCPELDRTVTVESRVIWMRGG